MTLQELKTNIENGTLEDKLLVLKCTDNTFIADQYIKEIARIKSKTIEYVNSLEDIVKIKADVFSDKSHCLFVYNVEDELDVTTNVTLNVTIFNDVIIRCTKIKKGSEEQVKDYLVTIPKLVEWQIEDYIQMQLPKVKPEIVQWLCKIASYNVFRLQSEIDKIKIFPQEEQESLIEQIYRENGYIDLNPLTIFNFTNAIAKKDIKTMINVLKSIENIDIEPAGLLTILTKNFKNIIDIQMSKNATAQSLGMNPKQFYAVKYNCGYYSNDMLVDIYKTLTSIDYKLKSGQLGYDKIIDYIVINVLKHV